MPAARIAWCRLTNLPPALLTVMIVGWIVAALQDQTSLPQLLCLSAGASVDLAAVLTVDPPVLLAPLAMLLAMMSPLMAEPLNDIWRRSIRRRRHRAVALFVAGYLTIWLAASIPLGLLAGVLGVVARIGGPPALAVAAVLVFGWQAAPLRQHCLNLCHRRPRLAGFGLDADADALRYGLTHGLWCIGACWALMLLPLSAGAWHLAAMAVVTVVILLARARPPRPPRWGFPGTFAGSLPALRRGLAGIAQSPIFMRTAP